MPPSWPTPAGRSAPRWTGPGPAGAGRPSTTRCSTTGPTPRPAWGQGGPHQPHRREQARLDGGADGVVVDLEGASGRRSPGVGHHDVDAAEPFHRRRHEPIGGGRVGDVGHDGEDVGPLGGQGLLGLVQRGLVPGTHHDAGPVGRQCLGTGPAETPRRRGHQRHLSAGCRGPSPTARCPIRSPRRQIRTTSQITTSEWSTVLRGMAPSSPTTTMSSSRMPKRPGK